VIVVRTQPRKTKTTKNMEFGVVWNVTKNCLKGRTIVYNRCGKSVYKVGGSLESIRPNLKRETRLMKECETGFNDMAMMMFGNAIMLRGMWWRYEMRDAKVGKKSFEFLKLAPTVRINGYYYHVKEPSQTKA